MTVTLPIQPLELAKPKVLHVQDIANIIDRFMYNLPMFVTTMLWSLLGSKTVIVINVHSKYSLEPKGNLDLQ